MSLGTSAIAAGSTMVFSRSIETWPERLREDVADRGLGDEPERHEHLAERRLEALLLGERDVELVLADDALGEQVCPSGIWESGAAWTVPTLMASVPRAGAHRARVELHRWRAPASRARS
jgi:hypothetical protein